MNIIATLQNCIIAMGGMAPRVDQPEIRNVAEAVIRTLNEVIQEMKRLDEEKKEKEEEADRADDHNEQKDV